MSARLQIDGKAVTAQQGESVLDCALRHDISIPHLCAQSNLDVFGGCRMCVVEIDGMRGFPTSCSTPAAEAMVVRTDTPALRKLRRNILGLVMMEHPSSCLVCSRRDLCEQYRPKAEKVGRTSGCHSCNSKEMCEVRSLSEELGPAELPALPTHHNRPLDRSNPFIDLDLNLCILCGRCVRVCKQHQGQAALDFIGRGSDTHIGQAFGQSLWDAGCQFCGSCIAVCPTGVLADRYAKWRGKADDSTLSTCAFCPAACALQLQTSSGRLTSTCAANNKVPLCVLGRFGSAEFLNGADRLSEPYVRIGAVLRETPWPQALEAAAEKLKQYTGASFALVCDTTSTIEDRHVFKKFTTDVMKSSNYLEIKPNALGVSLASLPSTVKAVLLTGNFVPVEQLEKIECLMVQDCYPTPVSERADILFPAAVFAETEGTLYDGSGQARPLEKACSAPGNAKPEWWIITELAKMAGAEGFNYASAAGITAELSLTDAELLIEPEQAPAPATDATLRYTHYRGHRLDEKVSGLRELPLADPLPVPAPPVPLPQAKGFTVVAKSEVSPNVHEIVIEAPHIARKALAGQFAIVMVDERSERAPYTLCDWDTDKGTITLIVLEMGQSSRKLVLLKAGDKIAHLVGPLGIPLEIKEYGTVALAAGCYGLGGILPIATAMKKAGNHVIGILEAHSHYDFYYQEKLQAACDDLILATIDGSLDIKGHAIDVVGQKLRDKEKIDLVVAVGCPFMMMCTGRETEPFGVETLVALNPIMVDGTGMCGVCRVTVGGETRFACVDGPFFDAHLVDWEELWDRRAAYSQEETDAVSRTESVAPKHDHGHACRCTT